MHTWSSKAIIVWMAIIMSWLLDIVVKNAISRPPPVEAPLARQSNFEMALAESLNLG